MKITIVDKKISLKSVRQLELLGYTVVLLIK